MHANRSPFGLPRKENNEKIQIQKKNSDEKGWRGARDGGKEGVVREREKGENEVVGCAWREREHVPPELFNPWTLHFCVPDPELLRPRP
eukprot:1305800-Rhodomonas_salina.1